MLNSTFVSILQGFRGLKPNARRSPVTGAGRQGIDAVGRRRTGPRQQQRRTGVNRRQAGPPARQRLVKHRHFRIVFLEPQPVLQLGDDLVDPASGDIAHREVMDSILLAHAIDFDDVTVVQAGHGLGFASKAVQFTFAAKPPRWQNLQCHLPAQRLLPGLIDDSHSAAAHLADDFIVTQVIAGLRSRGSAARRRGRVLGCQNPANGSHQFRLVGEPRQVLGRLGVFAAPHPQFPLRGNQLLKQMCPFNRLDF